MRRWLSFCGCFFIPRKFPWENDLTIEARAHGFHLRSSASGAPPHPTHRSLYLHMPLGRSPRRGQLVLSGYNGIRWGIQIFTNDDDIWSCPKTEGISIKLGSSMAWSVSISGALYFQTNTNVEHPLWSIGVYLLETYVCLLHDESSIRRVAPALQGPKSRGGMLENQHSIVPLPQGAVCVCIYIYIYWFRSGAIPPESDHFSENGALPRWNKQLGAIGAICFGQLPGGMMGFMVPWLHWLIKKWKKPWIRTASHVYYCGWLRNPAPIDRWFIPLFIGFQPSFWWCRISPINCLLSCEGLILLTQTESTRFLSHTHLKTYDLLHPWLFCECWHLGAPARLPGSSENVRKIHG